MTMKTKEKTGKTYGEKVAEELKQREADAAAKRAEKEAADATSGKEGKAPSTNKAAAASRAKRQARVMYPGLGMNAAGNASTKLKEWPADFDAAAHLPLTKKDFENEAPWLLHRAEKMEEGARRLREQAAAAKKYGNAADRAKAKKLLSMKETMKKLEADLIAQGINVDELEQSAPEVPEAPEAAAKTE